MYRKGAGFEAASKPRERSRPAKSCIGRGKEFPSGNCRTEHLKGGVPKPYPPKNNTNRAVDHRFNLRRLCEKEYKTVKIARLQLLTASNANIGFAVGSEISGTLNTATFTGVTVVP